MGKEEGHQLAGLVISAAKGLTKHWITINHWNEVFIVRKKWVGPLEVGKVLW